jgi:hypothetical protein
VALGAVAAGWPLQRHFFEHRYVDAGLPTDRINAYFRDVHHANVVVYGSVEIYPMAGLDLTNRVRFGAGPSIDPHADDCRTWAAVRRGEYNYVVFTQYGFVAPTHPPREWFTDDPAAAEVARDGNSVVYRVKGPLHPAECAT